MFIPYSEIPWLIGSLNFVHSPSPLGFQFIKVFHKSNTHIFYILPFILDHHSIGTCWPCRGINLWFHFIYIIIYINCAWCILSGSIKSCKESSWKNIFIERKFSYLGLTILPKTWSFYMVGITDSYWCIETKKDNS